MKNKKLLIAGIDPGTTIGYAVLDIEGSLIYLTSSKQLNLNSLISKTIELGKVVLVGTDKAKVPGLVESYAAKLGARVVNPLEDLKIDEKREMTKSYAVANEHQNDALASALLAFRESRALLDKIDFFVKENKKHDIKNRIKEIVITKRVSIKNAVSIIERKEEDRIIEKVTVEKRLAENDFLNLYNKIKKYEREIKLIKDYNNKLKKAVERLEKNQVKGEMEAESKKADDFRAGRIRFLERALKMKERDTGQLKFLIRKYNKVMSEINNFHILKKLDTLGINEFNFKNKVLNIQKNDILLVDEPNIASNEVIEMLKDKVFVILHKKPISGKNESRMPFIFMDVRNLKIEEDRYFGFIDKVQFEAEKRKIDWIKKMVENYQKEKEQLM